VKKVAISACLLGKACRYDGTDNRNDPLLETLAGCELIPFCPEDNAFGTPRPTMDLIEMQEGIRAISNETGEDLSVPVEAYVKDFFKKYREIDLFIGKDRSPSCGVCSAKLYDKDKVLISAEVAGLMAKEAMHRGIEAVDAEAYIEKVGDPTKKDKD